MSLTTVFERVRSPVAVGAILLGLYAAMHLAVGGLIHVLTPQDATAATRGGESMTLSVAAADFPSARDSSPSEPVGGRSAEDDNSRECTAATDYDCIVQ
jgi:hypothetical protein